MSEEKKGLEKHERLRVPEGWKDQARAFVAQLERIITSIYIRLSKLEKKLEGEIEEVSGDVVHKADVKNNLTTTGEGYVLDARQGRVLANGSARDSTKLPLSGGAMTGNISYTGSQATYEMIKFINNTSDTYGNGIAIGGGGATIIGGGESADTAKAQVNGGDEILYLCNDGDVHIYSNLQSGWSNGKDFKFDTNGNLTIPGTLTASGGTMTGTLSMKPSAATGTINYYTQDFANITSTTNGLTANREGGINFYNKDAANWLGGIHQVYIQSNGQMQMYMYARNYKTDGTQVNNYIYLYANKDGTTSYAISNPAGFRSAIGARSDTAPGSGAWFNGTPYVGTNGVMEIGKYIDFHATGATTSDYDARITASTSGLSLSGTTSGTFSGNLTGNVTGNCSGSSGSCTGNAASSTRLNAELVTIKTGSSAQQKISLSTLMTWLITTKGYIPSGTHCHRVIETSWDYAGNDILQLAINGKNFELQLAGVIIEFYGNATNYNTGTFRLRIHSSPTTNFTSTSGYTKFPVSHVAEYTCNGSGYTPTWKMLVDSAESITSISRSGTTFTATRADGTTFTFTQQDNNSWRGYQVKEYSYKYGSIAANTEIQITGTNLGVSTPSGYTPVALASISTGKKGVVARVVNVTNTGSNAVVYLYNPTSASIGSDLWVIIKILYLQT